MSSNSVHTQWSHTGRVRDSQGIRSQGSLNNEILYELPSYLVCTPFQHSSCASQESVPDATIAAVMAEVTISPSMPGENTKHSSMQEGEIPSLGHLSDPAPASAGTNREDCVSAHCSARNVFIV